MKQKYYFSILILFFPYSLFATTLKGHITDEKGEPLSFATVYIKGTSIGTSANASGDYTLELNPGSYSITCQVIGYESKTKPINFSKDGQTLDFKLPTQQLTIDEVVIRAGEDPAYTIMRKVIEKRAYHANLVKTLETDIYLKGALRTRDFPDKIMGISINDDDKTDAGIDSNGNGVLYLLEELSHYYYKAPNKNFNKVISVHQSGDPKGLGFATMPPITNIYDNNIRIIDGLNDRGFISPANSNAFHYYDYKFLGTYFQDNQMIDKIKVTPKRKYEPCFSGYVYVVDGEWVFSSIDLLLTKSAQINILDTLRLKQYYRQIAKGIWVIQSQVLHPTFKFFGIDFAGNFITSYSNQQVNQPIPEDRFNHKIISVYDSNATDQKLAYWDTIRPIPLEKDEIKDFKLKDSLYVVQKKETDSIFRTTIYNYDFLISGFNIKYKNNNFHTRSLIGSVAYNSVEGINGTLDMSYHFKNKNNSYDVELLNRYGFSNHHYNPLLKIGMTISDTTWRTRNWRWQLTAGQYVYQINNKNPISTIMNQVYTLFGGRNFMKLYENRLGRITLDRNLGNGLTAAISLSYEQRTPLFNSTDYSFVEKHDERIMPNQPTNLPPLKKADAALISLAISYQPGYHYIQFPNYKMPISGNVPLFSARYTKGIPDIFNAVSNFDKWSVDIQHQFGMHMLGRINYRLEAGGFLNKKVVNLPDYKHLNGNQTFLAGNFLHSFQLAPYYRFSNDADLYLQAHVEWHLGGLLTNKIPLFRHLNWFLLAGSNVLYINQNNYYAEVFVGLENIGYKIFRFGRVDFIAGYESGKTEPSLGIRISFGQLFESLLGTSKNSEL